MKAPAFIIIILLSVAAGFGLSQLFAERKNPQREEAILKLTFQDSLLSAKIRGDSLVLVQYETQDSIQKEKIELQEQQLAANQKKHGKIISDIKHLPATDQVKLLQSNLSNPFGRR